MINAFQSLIGTIKTKFTFTKIDEDEQFQSLIGTIKTVFLFDENEIEMFVSIPYRDDKNTGHSFILATL